jgi:hypothetical protein
MSQPVLVSVQFQGMVLFNQNGSNVLSVPFSHPLTAHLITYDDMSLSRNHYWSDLPVSWSTSSKSLEVGRWKKRWETKQCKMKKLMFSNLTDVL